MTTETPKDIGTGPRGQVKRWKLELELADKTERGWRKDAERVIKRYRGEDCRADSHEGGTEHKKNAFNILWSNTETLRPALYNSRPKPRVRRRFRDKDDIGQAVSEVLERSLDYSVDAYDFSRTIVMAVDDYLLPGRAVTRVRYMPTIQQGEPDEDGAPTEEVTYEETVCEHVNWEDFRRGPGRTWDEIMWVAFRHKMDREQLVDKFGEKGQKVKLNLSVKDDTQKKEGDEEHVFDRAEIWEVWDKTKRQVLFISLHENEPLSVEDDPLNLEDFYPIPRPLYALESSNSMVPVPEYQLYETLAKELDRCTGRIMRILEGLRLRGVYDSTMAELDRLFEAGDNKMIPAENLAKIIQQGGIEASIWMLPVTDYADVLNNLYQYRAALIQSVYEITGVSDILRGNSDARETARAQQIKSNWGSLRIQRRQREIQRYARDLIRLKAEIIAENFSIETLQAMTGLDYPTDEDKQQAQQVLQAANQQLQMMQMQAQAQGQEPEIDEQLQKGMEAARNIINKPSWENIKDVMSSDILRGYKVEVETDSTIAEQMTEEKQDVVDMLRGLVEFSNGVGEATQQGVLPPKAVKALLLASVRRFRLGTEVEESIEEAEVAEGGDTGPSPEEIEAQVKITELQFKQQEAKEKHQMEMRKLQMEAEFAKAKHQMEMEKLQAKTQGDIMEQQAQAEHDVIKNQAEAEGEVIKQSVSNET